MPAFCCLKSTVRQPLATMVGLTQASSVSPFVRSRLLASLTVTQLELPLKESALPYLPALDQAVLAVVPPLALPEASATVVPAPSSNPYAATRPGGGPWFRLTAYVAVY